MIACLCHVCVTRQEFLRISAAKLPGPEPVLLLPGWFLAHENYLHLSVNVVVVTVGWGSLVAQYSETTPWVNCPLFSRQGVLKEGKTENRNGEDNPQCIQDVYSLENKTHEGEGAGPNSAQPHSRRPTLYLSFDDILEHFTVQ